MPNDWMIYGRERGKKKFRAFDGSGFTDKLAFALRFPPDQGEKVAGIVAQLNADNPDFEFEARRGSGTIFGDKPQKTEPKDDRVQKDMGVALITESESGNYVIIRFRRSPSKDALSILYGNGFTEGPPGVWKCDYDEVSKSVAERAAELTEDLPEQIDVVEGDYAIFGRQRGIGKFRPFDGRGFGNEPMRWPSTYRQTVMGIAESLGLRNPGLEFEVRQLSDTIYGGKIDRRTAAELDGRNLRDLIVPVPHWGSFGGEDPSGGSRVTPVKDYPMDYSTQVFDMEIISPPIEGRRTATNKARAMDSAITEISGGNVTVMKSSMEKGVYYAVLEACNPDLGSCQRILVTGRLLDAPNGGVRTYLLQSDTGSTFLDCPRSYLKLLDEPRTAQDEKYRSMVVERLSGDGRPWNKRRYRIGKEEMDSDKMVSTLAKSSGKTPWEIQTTRDIRAMRVFDEVDVGGSRLTRIFNRKGRR